MLKVKECIARDGISDLVIYPVWLVVVELGAREGRSRRPFLPRTSPGLGFIEGTSTSFTLSWDDDILEPPPPPRLLSTAVTIVVTLSSGAQGTVRQITLP